MDEAGIAALTANGSLRVVPGAVLHATGASFGASSVDPHVMRSNPEVIRHPTPDVASASRLVDTGVTATPDLRGSRLVRGPDLSGEGDGVDRYGHGTFMAGLIAGDGTASRDEGTRHVGVAPGDGRVGKGRRCRRFYDRVALSPASVGS